jgi:hypothetical protein
MLLVFWEWRPHRVRVGTAEGESAIVEIKAGGYNMYRLITTASLLLVLICGWCPAAEKGRRPESSWLPLFEWLHPDEKSFLDEILIPIVGSTKNVDEQYKRWANWLLNGKPTGSGDVTPHIVSCIVVFDRRLYGEECGVIRTHVENPESDRNRVFLIMARIDGRNTQPTAYLHAVLQVRRKQRGLDQCTIMIATLRFDKMDGKWQPGKRELSDLSLQR